MIVVMFNIVQVVKYVKIHVLVQVSLLKFKTKSCYESDLKLVFFFEFPWIIASQTLYKRFID